MRYMIFDFMHLVHKYYNTKLNFEHTTLVNGVVKTFKTTIPTCTIKHIVRCAGFGVHKVAVCLEGGSDYRKNYFAQCRYLNEDRKEDVEYKGTRNALRGELKEGADLAISCMVNGGVSCYRRRGYEADDFIYTLVCMLKEQGVQEPIDIITNDRDMLPLVDNQVSVYIKSNRQFSDIGCPEMKGYFQVTPRSMEMYCSMASEYKNFKLPYNSILLYKLVRGDTSDNIPMAAKGYGGKKFTEMIDTMIKNDVQFDKVFRYGNDFDTVIGPVLHNYFDEITVEKMREIYGGLCLRRIIPENGTMFAVMPNYLNEARLQTEVGKYNIHLGRGARS